MADEDEGKIDRLFGMAAILTTSQWKDLHKSKLQDPVQAFWFAWLQEAMSDWNKLKRSPTRSAWKEAKDLIKWPDSESFNVVAEVINQLYHIDEGRFKQGFIRWLNVDSIRTDPKFNFLREEIELEFRTEKKNDK